MRSDNEETGTMQNGDAPFSMLDEAAITAAELRHDPYDFAFVEHALDPDLKDTVLADAPEIPYRGSYALRSLSYGPKFAAVITDLLAGKPGPPRDIVLANASVALWTMGKASDLPRGVARAREAIDSGAARKKLDALKCGMRIADCGSKNDV